MKKLATKSHGFTIVELLIYCAILTSFLYVISQIFTSILDTQLGSESVSAVAQDSRYILARLDYDIARASDVVIPAANGDTTSSLELVVDGDDYTYTVQNGNLVLSNTKGSGALNSFGTTMSNISFERLGTSDVKSTVQIKFTLTSNIVKTSGPEVRSFQTTIGLR